MAKPSADALEIFYSHGLDVASRTVFLETDDVNHDSVTTAIKGLHLLSRSPGPISLILNTGGGDVQQGMALYDFVRSLEQEVTIIARGECYSMGAIILQAGDVRAMSAHSTLMIHDGDANVEGYNRQTKKAWSDIYQKYDKWTDDILLSSIKKKHPDFTMKRLQSWLARDTILDATAALDLGLIDRIT